MAHHARRTAAAAPGGLRYALTVVVTALVVASVTAVGEGSSSGHFTSARRTRLLQAIVHKEGMAAVLSSHKGGGLLPRRAHGRECRLGFLLV